MTRYGQAFYGSDEITILARKLCDAESKAPPGFLKFSYGDWDDHENMHLAKAAIVAGMELQKGCEA